MSRFFVCTEGLKYILIGHMAFNVNDDNKRNLLCCITTRCCYPNGIWSMNNRYDQVGSLGGPVVDGHQRSIRACFTSD